MKIIQKSKYQKLNNRSQIHNLKICLKIQNTIVLINF